MKTNTRRIAAATVIMLVVVSLAVPATALPGPARTITPAAKAAIGDQAAEQRVANLRNRITNVLAARKARFDAATAALVRRQARLEVLAGKLEAAGGDVSRFRIMLQESEQALVQAREQEQVCIQAFLGVPDAADKGAAFRAAKAEGREAIEILKQSRIRLREATRELRDVLRQLREGEES